MELVSGTQVAAPQDPNSLDPFFAKDSDVLKTYAFDYDAICMRRRLRTSDFPVVLRPPLAAERVHPYVARQV